MDTLSTSVSSLSVPTLRRYSADFHHFKNPYTTSSSSSHFTFPKPTSISNKSKSFTHKKTTNFHFLTQNPPLKQPSSSKHQQEAHTRASTGYGNFNKQLVGLMKLLVEKSKFGIVTEVLMEFEKVKMEKDKVLGIAKKVQELSGAEKVKVKVRNLVNDKKRSRSFAL
ncbi:unnamed protein product [Withania somnifera]